MTAPKVPSAVKKNLDRAEAAARGQEKILTAPKVPRAVKKNLDRAEGAARGQEKS